jgi:hypothetical protein
VPFPSQVERWRALVRDLSPDDLKDDPGFQRIALATIQAESGGDPARPGDYEGQHPHSIGLFQLHDQGMGSGLSAGQRSDPRVNAGRAVPALAAAYRRTGGNPALTYKQAINPGAALDGPQVQHVLAAYQQGGGSVDPQDDRTKGATERATGVAPARVAPPTSDKLRTLEAQLGAARTALEAAQARVTAAAAPDTADRTMRTAAQNDAADRARATELTQATAALNQARSRVSSLDAQRATEADALARAAAKPPKPPSGPKDPWVGPDGVTRLYENGEWVPHPELGVKPPTGTATPKATRTWTDSQGVQHTETAPDEGGFSPVTDVADPNAMTDYQAGELGISQQHLPIYQQQADASSLSAAAAMLHAQVAKGTMDFDTAKQVFDYVIAQQAPVEEGGKLYQSGYEPSSHIRQVLHLNTEPYSVVDAAGFYGRPELNQYVHGGYPFGAGPMSPAEYQQRQAGTFQGAPSGPPPPTPQPAMASSSAGTMLADQQGGGFAPPPTPPPPAPPSGPAFGGVTQPMSEPPMPQQPPPQAPDGDLQKIVAMLVQKGFPPEVAQAAAQQHLGMGGMPAQY